MGWELKQPDFKSWLLHWSMSSVDEQVFALALLSINYSFRLHSLQLKEEYVIFHSLIFIILWYKWGFDWAIYVLANFLIYFFFTICITYPVETLQILMNISLLIIIWNSEQILDQYYNRGPWEKEQSNQGIPQNFYSLLFLTSGKSCWLETSSGTSQYNLKLAPMHEG